MEKTVPTPLMTCEKRRANGLERQRGQCRRCGGTVVRSKGVAKVEASHSSRSLHDAHLSKRDEDLHSRPECLHVPTPPGLHAIGPRPVLREFDSCLLQLHSPHVLRVLPGEHFDRDGQPLEDEPLGALAAL